VRSLVVLRSVHHELHRNAGATQDAVHQWQCLRRCIGCSVDCGCTRSKSRSSQEAVKRQGIIALTWGKQINLTGSLGLFISEIWINFHAATLRAEHSDHVHHEKPILSSASNSADPSQYQRPDKDRNLGYLMDRSSHTCKFQLAGHATFVMVSADRLFHKHDNPWFEPDNAEGYCRARLGCTGIT